MNQGVAKVRELLVKELTSQKYRKNDLTEIYSFVFHAEASGKKQEIAERVADYITKELTSELRKYSLQELSKQAIRDYSLGIVEQMLAQYKFKEFNLGISRKINEFLNSENTEQSASMSRHLRPNQEVIENIWDPSKQVFTDCLCPKAPSNL